MKKTILVVEDERSIADALIFALEQENYNTIWVELGGEALDIVSKKDIDLILLDVGLPDINGFELCKEIKTASDIPIIFLTARKEEVDKIIGLEIGADDYVTKPFSLRELTSRIKIIINRYERMYKSEKSSTISKHEENCFADTDKKTIIYFGEELDLTRYQYLILKILINNPNRVYSRSELMEYVWDEPDKSFDRAVDTHIKTIRSKLNKIKPDLKPIKTHHGLGYSFTASEVK
jgi:two-component system, OmpR family, catabolic regulation response regulator CreB